MKEKYNKPCLVYYMEANPDYGKEYTIDDIETPSEIEYGYYEDNSATLRRKCLSYLEWSRVYKECTLKSKITNSICVFRLNKIAICSLSDLEVFYKENKNSIICFIDDDLNVYFSELID